MKPIYIVEGMDGRYYNSFATYTEARDLEEQLLSQGHKVRVRSDYESK